MPLLFFQTLTIIFFPATTDNLLVFKFLLTRHSHKNVSDFLPKSDLLGQSVY